MQETTDLSERELEILRLVATGASNKQIAQQLFISPNTVKVHLKNIFAKIGVASRTEAAMHAVRIGIVHADELAPAGEGEDAQISPKNWLAVSQLESTGVPLFRQRIIWILLSVIILVSVFGYFIGINVVSFFQSGVGSPTEPGPGDQQITDWQVRQALPTARWGLATCTYEGEIYTIGGETRLGIVDTNESYNARANSWMAKKPKPVPVADIQAALIGGKIYLPGGRQTSGEVTPILEVYDPRTDRWEIGASMPVALSAYALVSFEGKIYIFGGWDGNRFVDTVLTYDPGRDIWEQKTSMPTARGYAGAAVADGKIYVIGGFDGRRSLEVNEFYQPDLDGKEIPWDTAAPLPVGRYAMGLVGAADIIHLVGGVSDEQANQPALIYFPQRDEWQQFEASLLPQPRSYLSLVFLDRHIYVIGGLIGDEPSDLNQTYQVIYSVAIPMIR